MERLAVTLLIQGLSVFALIYRNYLNINKFQDNFETCDLFFLAIYKLCLKNSL